MYLSLPLSVWRAHTTCVFSSCAYHPILCRLGMWTARLSVLCMCCHIHCSETTPRRIHYLSEVLKLSLRLPARSQSGLTSLGVFLVLCLLFCCFRFLIYLFYFFFSSSLSESFSFLCVLERSCKASWLKPKLCVRKHLHVWRWFGKIAIPLSLKWSPI